MKTITCTRIFNYLGHSLVLLSFIGQALGSVTGICKTNSTQSVNITLDLILSYLAMYEGNCTCTLKRINTPGDVTMVSDIQIESCDSVTLNVDPWNFTAGCPGRHVFNSTYPVIPGEDISIFMARINRKTSASISGSITFVSRNGDDITLFCHEALYDIPPSTIPTPTPIKTTTPDVPVTPTIIGIAAGVVFGFIFLMLIIVLCCIHRQRRKRAHNAEHTNMTGEIPEADRERNDPEMTRLSWYRSIPIRLKRFYGGDTKKKTREANRRSARHLSESYMRNGPTGTTTGRALRRLFRPKSSSRMNSREGSTVEDDLRNSVTQDEINGDVFDEVSPHHGGGIFMDAKRTSCENLEHVPSDESKNEKMVTVHNEIPSENKSAVFVVGSLFEDITDGKIPPGSSSWKDKEEKYEDGDYATIDMKQKGETDEISINGSFDEQEAKNIQEKQQNQEGNLTDVPISNEIPSPTEEVFNESGILSHSVNGDVYTIVNKNNLKTSLNHSTSGYLHREEPSSKDEDSTKYENSADVYLPSPTDEVFEDSVIPSYPVNGDVFPVETKSTNSQVSAQTPETLNAETSLNEGILKTSRKKDSFKVDDSNDHENSGDVYAVVDKLKQSKKSVSFS